MHAKKKETKNIMGKNFSSGFETLNFGNVFLLCGLCGLKRLKGAGERKKYLSQRSQSSQSSWPKTQELSLRSLKNNSSVGHFDLLPNI
jgi:hypothetical protein